MDMEGINFILKLIWAIVLLVIIIVAVYITLIQMRKSNLLLKKFKKNNEFEKEFEEKKCQECGEIFWVNKSVIGDYLREPKCCGPCSKKLLAEVDGQIAGLLENIRRSK